MSEQIKFISSRGEEILLNEEGKIEYLYGRTGAFTPPFSLILDKRVNQDGSMYRETFTDSSEVEIPIQVRGRNGAELWERLRTLRRILNPKKGLGQLIVTTPDGLERELLCLLSDFVMDESENNTFVHPKAESIQKLMLVFTAPYPYWSSTSILTHTFRQGEASSFFPFFPLILSSSQVFSEETVENEGEVDAFPIWIIHGPGRDIVLRNKTTGQSLSLSTQLMSGETLTIDTYSRIDPHRLAITRNDGTDCYKDLIWGSDLWLLEPGLNAITIEMNNTTAESYVQLSYRNWYMGV